MLLLEAPEEAEESYEIKEYRYNGRSGSILIGANKSYRIICREDSNTLLVKEGEEVSRVVMCLECAALPYGERDLLEVLPEVPIDHLEEEKYYLPLERIEQILPMAYTEYLAILRRNNGVLLEKKKKKFFGRVEDAVLLDAFLLTRSLLVSNREEQLQQGFEEVFPGALFQLVQEKIQGKTKEEAEALLIQEILSLLRSTTASPEEFQRALKLNGLHEDACHQA